MMTLNYNEKDFQKKLQKDIEMPEIVHEHINQAYRLIENNAVLQKKASKDPYHWMKSGGRIAGGMAAVLAVGFVFCAINPVMANLICRHFITSMTMITWCLKHYHQGILW